MLEPDFRAQVEYLGASGYEAVLPRELMKALDGGLRLPERPVVFTFDDTLLSVYRQAFPILRAAGFRAAVYAVADQIGGHNAWDEGKDLPYEACMDDTALLRLQAAGWEIGSHSRSHSALTELEPEELREEVAGSKASLERRFGKIDSFCYPFATYNPLVRQAVIDAAYTNALALRGPTRSVTDDRFVMRRVFVKGTEGLDAFRRKVSLWYLAYRGLRRT
ncbi:MAG TPA: polysaccharide deacetylase family protein [bacterium]|nr:polysaccharide deacetylase family protein [bacterium]